MGGEVKVKIVNAILSVHTIMDREIWEIIPNKVAQYCVIEEGRINEFYEKIPQFIFALNKSIKRYYDTVGETVGGC